MGKNRRAKAVTRRALVTKRSRYLVTKRDQRGRDVPLTVEAYEDIAGTQDRVVEAMIARHTLRMERTQEIPAVMRIEAMTILSSAAIVDRTCRDLGATSDRSPPFPGHSWPSQLHWALDSAVATVRLLLAGQVVGGAAMARNQLERWTANRAFMAGVTREPNESESEFIARAWTTPIERPTLTEEPELAFVFYEDTSPPAGQPEVRHSQVQLTDGRSVCPVAVWRQLSEILHGRGDLGAAEWEILDLLDPGEMGPDVLPAAAAVVDAAAMCMAHLRRVLETICLANGWFGQAATLRKSFDSFSDGNNNCIRVQNATVSDGTTFPAMFTYMPLVPGEGLSPGIVSLLKREASFYDGVMMGERPHGRLYTDDEFTRLTFTNRRYKCVLSAQRALAGERERLGVEFDLDSLNSRSTRWTLVCESMAMYGGWSSETRIREAAVTAASALRSAYWLWLEDDDRSMAVCRCALEQIARARAWRLRPGKAQSLENRPNAAPNRWLEIAGWKRLGPLNRALGQFAHMHSWADWEGAREILNNVQIDAEDPQSIYTARRSALELTEELMAREAVDGLRSIAPLTAHAIQEHFAKSDLRLDHMEPSVQRHFNHVWMQNLAK